jgi:hypothetical protein
MPTLGLDHLLDRSVKFSASNASQPTGLDADAAWAALERAGAGVREALNAGDGLALDKAFMPQTKCVGQQRSASRPGRSALQAVLLDFHDDDCPEWPSRDT